MRDHGYDVAVYDNDSAALDAGARRMGAYAEELVAAGRIGSTTRDQALGHVTWTSDPAAAATEVDILSESVPEDPALKGRVLGQFNALCPARTIFTTNTSSLLPSTFAGATGRPDRFVALHFHQPVWLSNVVDVMPLPATSAETTDLLWAFARKIGQIPILVRKESPGYVFDGRRDFGRLDPRPGPSQLECRAERHEGPGRTPPGSGRVGHTLQSGQTPAPPGRPGRAGLRPVSSARPEPGAAGAHRPRASA